MAGLPTGTVTFLFTDLEGSTRLWEEHPEAMKGALARHDEILRAAVEHHDGAVVKTTGDGLHAAFATADHALAAAVDAQWALLDEVWPLPEPLRVRMGVHTGSAEERDGDYYGPAVNRAARVSAAAHGCQILVSHAAEELARDTLPPGTALVDLGEHRLRDLARAERVFQLTAPGLPGEFPPPRSVDAYPGNLPVQLSSFIGRETEIRTIADALRDTRLVTLTGVGGVGKTRLATQVAAELLPYFADGAWFCELASAANAESLLEIVVAALGITPREGVTLAGSIVEYLGTKELLVVLDNCEHLVDPAGALAESVLRECPKVRILATSREGLGIEGEQMRVVRSLPLPDADADAASIAVNDATRLFLERARSAQGDLALDDDAMAAVAEICRRLDGIPLAIELAAARVVGMAPAEIARRLDERFRLLTGGRRTAVERHHTLRATVDWSYSLLAERERTVFDRLGAFSGSFDTEAAQAVAADEDIESWDVLDALSDLAAKSMIVREPRSDTTRYTLLETLRQYARERLDEHDEADAVRRRHAAHYATVAGQLDTALRSADEVAARERLRDDLDNLRAAVSWSLDRDDPADRVLALTTIAHLALETNFDRTLGIGQWAIRARPFTDDVDPWVRCGVLAAASEELRNGGQLEAAIALARDALRDGVTIGGPGMGVAFIALAASLGVTGRSDEAVSELLDAKHAMEAARMPAYDRGIVAVLAATFAGFGGRPDLAEALAEEALTIARTEGTPGLLSSAFYAYANATEWKDPRGALDAYEESIRLTRAGANSSAYSPALAWASMLWHRSGDTATGIDRAVEAIEHSWQVRDYSNLPNGIVCSAVILADLGRLESSTVVIGGCAQDALGINEIALHDPRWNLASLQERLRKSLGDDTFRVAMARGRSMAMQELVDYAITEMRRLRDDLDRGSTR